MKKLLAVTAILAISASAIAQDKGTEFKFGGELRTRYSLTNNPTYVDSKGVTEQQFQQRNQFHINAITGDKLQAYFNLIHSTLWGAGQAVPTHNGLYAGAGTLGRPANTATSDANSLQVNEAWMWWKASDNMSLKAGRQGVQYGDGIVFSRNDHNTHPYNVDGLMGRFSWDFVDLDFGGGKFADFGVTSPITTTNQVTGGATAGNTDTEINFYGLVAAFKNLPDILKKAEVFVAQINSDTSGSAPTFVPGVSTTALAPTAAGWNLTTYGLHVKGEAAIVDFRLDGAMQSGKQKNGGLGTSAGQDLTLNGYMFDVELGANFPEFMKARVYLGYHMDTGDDGSTGDKQEGYQPLFNDTHRTGMMNAFGYGNLTDIKVGFNLKPSEDTTVGVEYNMASRSTDKAAATFNGVAFGNLTNAPTLTTTTSLTTPANSDKNIGSELDVWANHNYGNGFSMLAGVGYLIPGAYFKPAGAASTGSAIQVVAQGKYTF